jgi:heterodisulfide reductase subunit C
MDSVSKKDFDDFVLTMGSQIVSLRDEISKLKKQINIKENGIKTN